MFKQKLYIYDVPPQKLLEAAQELQAWRVQVQKAGPFHIWVIGSESAVKEAVWCAEQAIGRSVSVADNHEHQVTGKDLDLGL